MNTLVFDLDGTLLDSQKNLSSKTVEKLVEAQENGYRIVLASGRPLPSMVRYAQQLQLARFGSYLVAFNGAVILRMSDRKRMYEKNLLPEDQPILIDYLSGHGVTISTYDYEGNIVVDTNNEYGQLEPKITGVGYTVDYENVHDPSIPRVKYLGIGDPERMKAVREDLKGRIGKQTTFVQSSPYLLDFAHEEVSKGQALRRLSKIADFSLEETIAFGDANNDADLLQTAGLGIAMKNGMEELKNTIGRVTERDNNHEGVLFELTKMGIL